MMNRRDVIKGSVALGLAGLSSQAFAKSDAKSAVAPSVKNPKLAELAKAASECVMTGEACAAHCRRELGEGHMMFSKCEKTTADMLSLTKAMVELAAAGSPYAVRLASLCADACKACAEACAEHKEHFAHGMHTECKACMDACEKCVKACQTLAA